MRDHRINNVIVCCIILALVLLIPLTGVVADATIRSDKDVNVNGNASLDNNVGDNAGSNLDTEVEGDIIITPDTDIDNGVDEDLTPDTNPDGDDDTTIEGGDSDNGENGDINGGESNDDTNPDINPDVNPDDDNNGENGDINDGSNGENGDVNEGVTPDNGGNNEDVNNGNNGEDGDTDSDEKVEEVEPVKYFVGKTISFTHGLEMVVYVNADALAGKNVTLEIVKPRYDAEGTIIGEETTILTEYATAKIYGINTYKFIYCGITAKECATEISMTIYADDEMIAGTTYSIKEYAMVQLAKSVVPANMKTLLVDLLNYGSAAQTFFDYNTANLANADLTDVEKAYATQDIPEFEAVREIINGEDNLVDAAGLSIILANTIKSKIHFYLNDCTPDDIYAVIEYVDGNGNKLEKIYDGSEFDNRTKNLYAITFEEYGVLQMEETYTVKFYSKSDDAQVGDTLTNNVYSYIAGVMNNADADPNHIAVVVALLKHSESLKAYFG